MRGLLAVTAGVGSGMTMEQTVGTKPLQISKIHHIARLGTHAVVGQFQLSVTHSNGRRRISGWLARKSIALGRGSVCFVCSDSMLMRKITTPD